VEKAPDAFRTISEVAEELDIPQHVLRFWESRFPQIRPMKRAGGRRYYRPDDVDLLRGIRHLLYGVGYTIRGVQGVLREKGPKFVQTVWQPGAMQPETGPQDEVAEDEQQLAPDEAARAMFGLLKSPEREPAAIPEVAPAAPATPALSREDARRLQAALHELTECRRLVDDALRGEAA
jgi:DNA-binding transcriptional MerR regulator